MDWKKLSAGHYEAETADWIYNIDKMDAGYWRLIRTPVTDPEGDCEDLMGYQTLTVAKVAAECEEDPPPPLNPNRTTIVRF